MSEYRIEVTDREEFEPREWLRREVLWGYFMTPYSRLYESWEKGLALDYYNGNASRRDLYATYPDDNEMMAKSFINHGKVIAGLLSVNVMFRAMRGGQGKGFVDILELQASTVDRALANKNAIEPNEDAIKDIHNECTGIVMSIPMSESDTYRNSRRLFKASKLIGQLVGGEIKTWLDTAKLRDERGRFRPRLRITDGGNARSAGPRVDMLTPIFQQVVDYSRFQELEVIERTLPELVVVE